ncbi:MAG: hypothetical protein HRU41_33445 [Saprospiraceae bacterium]|nr:hypothetical protein [Saprospiraceae bacterium]
MEKLSYLLTSRLLWIMLAVVSLSACKSEYEQRVEKELASGVTQDSLILGLRMGLSKQEYFDACWELNRQQQINSGTGDASAHYITDRDSNGLNTLRSKDVLFFGVFDEEDIMRGMQMTYSFVAWAPWNRNMQSDSLLLHLRDEFLLDYPGNDFIELKLKEAENPALVKIDGNRQILMYAKGKKDVVVKIEDLQYKLKEQWKKE